DRAGGAGAGWGERADRGAPEGDGRIRRRQRIAVGVFGGVGQEAGARDLELGQERRGADGDRIEAGGGGGAAELRAGVIAQDGEAPRPSGPEACGGSSLCR